MHWITLLHIAWCLYGVISGVSALNLKISDTTRELESNQSISTNQSLRAQVTEVPPLDLSADQIRAEESLKIELTKLKHRPHWEKCSDCQQIPLEPATTPSPSAREPSVKTQVLRRTITRFSQAVRLMSEKIDTLEKWKTGSEERIASLEKLVKQMQLQTTAYDSHWDTQNDLAQHDVDTPDADANFPFAVSNFHENRRGDEMASSRSKSQHQRKGANKRQAPVSASELENLIETVTYLNKTVQRQGTVMYRLHSRVGRTQRYSAMKFRLSEKKTREAKKKADGAVKNQQQMSDKLERLSTKIDNQELTLNLLQSDILNYNGVIVQAKRESKALIAAKISALNESFSQKFDAMAADNSEAVDTLTKLISIQADTLSSLSDQASNLQSIQSEMMINASGVVIRLSRHHKRLENIREMMRVLQKSNDQQKTSYEVNRARIDSLNSTLREFREKKAIQKEEIMELHRSITWLNTTLELEREQIKTCNSELQAIRNETSLNAAKIKDVGSKIEAHEHQENSIVETIRQEVDAMKLKIETSCNYKTDAIFSINSTIMDLKVQQNAEFKILNRFSKDQNKTIADLEKRLDTQEKMLSNVTGDIKLSGKKSLTNGVDELELSNASVPTIFATYGSKLASLEERTGYLEREFSNLNTTRRTNPPTEIWGDNSTQYWNEIERIRKKQTTLDSKMEKLNVTADTVMLNLQRVQENLMTNANALTTIQQQISKLNYTTRIDTLVQVTEMQRQRLDEVNSTVKTLSENNKDVTVLVGSIQQNIRIQQKRLASLSMQSNSSLDQINKLKSEFQKVVSQSSKKYDSLSRTIENNISAIEDQLLYLRSDVDVNYNSTGLIFDLIDSEEERVTKINREMTTLLSSMMSSVARFDTTLQESNQSIWLEIDDLKEWLTDFQDAFDTSNRLLGQHIDDYFVMKKNVSNQFIHLTTSVDYITQIVQETNKAVDENRERLITMNETILYLRLSIPTLVATGTNEEDYDVDDEDPFFQYDYEPDLYQDNGENIENGQGLGSDSRRIQDTADRPSEIDYPPNYDFRTRERRKRFIRDIRRIDHEVSFIFNAIDSLQSSIYRIGNESNTEEKSREKDLEERGRDVIAFSAGLTLTHDCCGTVVFDKIFSNQRSAYNPTTGKFTAVSGGLYAFFVSILERNRFISAALVLNGMPLITVRMDHSNGDYEQSQSTNSVIVPLVSGDQVWLQTYTGSLQGYQSPAVTFSGFSFIMT